MDKEANTIEDDDQPRRSTRETREPDRFAGKSKTTWRPGTMARNLGKAVLLGLCLLPTVLLAEPMHGLKDMGTAGLFSETTSMQPLDTSTRKEQLRAYHASLDLMNDAYSPDLTNNDWKPEMIDKYVVKDRPDGTKNIVFKVHWTGGDKSWVKMDDLRLHDAFCVIRYGLRNKLTNKPGWEWVNAYMDSDAEISRMIRAHKVSTQNVFKFGVLVPKTTREARLIDCNRDAKLWDEAISIELKQITDYDTFRVLESYEPLPLGYK